MCRECGRGRQQLGRGLCRGLCHTCYERARCSGELRSNLVDATPAKIKIAELLDAGWGTRRIAQQAGVDRRLVRGIMAGRARIAAKTRAAVCALDAEPDPAAIAHRALCEAGVRGDYVSPHRKYRQARAERDKWMKKWIADELDAEELAVERRKERRLPFPQVYAELRDHCGLADWEIAKRLGVQPRSLLRRLDNHRIKATPDFVTMCTEVRKSERAARCV